MRYNDTKIEAKHSVAGVKIMENCVGCKWLDADWLENDDGDEYEVYYCDKHVVDGNFDPEETPRCEKYKKYRPKPYKEKDTLCDTCERLRDCVAGGKVIECTTTLDTRQHYIAGFSSCPIIHNGAATLL